MGSISHERRRLMTKISIMYYHEGLSQQQITDKLNISRSQVSRMLSNARSEGIVDISIKDDFADERKYETWLCHTFNLENALVVDAGQNDDQVEIKILANGISEILEDAIKDNDVVGVSAGNTVGDICTEIKAWSNKKIDVVPLVGGIGANGTKWQANSNVRRFAEAFKARGWQLNAPVIMTNDAAFDMIVREPEIGKVLSISRDCDVVITGIGQVSNDATIIKTGFLSDEVIKELVDNGAKASVCGSFLDENGNVIEFGAMNRMIGLTVQDLEKIRQVIAVSWGSEKIAAITAALKGNWMNTLVTTLTTVKGIVSYTKSSPS